MSVELCRKGPGSGGRNRGESSRDPGNFDRPSNRSSFQNLSGYLLYTRMHICLSHIFLLFCKAIFSEVYYRIVTYGGTIFMLRKDTIRISLGDN